ncbi:MAG: aminotransferase class IV, partial [Nitrospira sp.]|nr:aminotransferase class IV [Nitrospira sp.]
ETLRAYQGKIFKVREHVSRLFQSLKIISLAFPITPDDIQKILTQTLEANRLKDARLRITISRGPDEIGLEPKAFSSPTMVVIAKAFSGYPEIFYEKGVDVAVVKTRKTSAVSLDPRIKSLNYLNHLLAKMESQKIGVFEGILLNQEGYLCEGTVSNFFLVKQGHLLTPAPSCGILEGITRQTVLELAQKAGIPVKEESLMPDEIVGADECFLTNTTMELIPVVRIKGLATQQEAYPLGNGCVGPTTRFLLKGYRELVM